LEKENDEQRDRLNETIKNEKALTLALRKSTKDYKDVLKQLEAVEIEV
jgi:ABC-type transporter Mla subunit MlaD